MYNLALASGEEALQPLESRRWKQYKWFQHGQEAYQGSFHCTRIVLEVDVSLPQSPYNESDEMLTTHTSDLPAVWVQTTNTGWFGLMLVHKPNPPLLGWANPSSYP